MFRRLEHNLASDRSVSWLRGAAALWTLLCVLWLGVVLRTPVGLGFGLLGTLIALAWAAMIAKTRRRTREDVALCLTPEKFVYQDGLHSIEQPWTNVNAIEVDEEQLNVIVTCRAGEPVRIEPLFEAMGVYELADALRAAWAEASGTQ